MKLCYCHFAHASNAWIIQVFKPIDKIKLSYVIISNCNNNQFFLDLEVNDREGSELDIDMYITLALLNKIMKSIS